MNKNRLQNIRGGITAMMKDHIAKQAAVFIKLKPMQVVLPEAGTTNRMRS